MTLYFTIWYIPIVEKSKDTYTISALKKTDYPPMEWTSAEEERTRYFGGNRMYLGDEMDL